MTNNLYNNMINNYKQYNESIKSNESIYFDEYLINEGFNLDSLKKLNSYCLLAYLCVII